MRAILSVLCSKVLVHTYPEVSFSYVEPDEVISGSTNTDITMPGVCLIAGRVPAFPAERLAKNALISIVKILTRGLGRDAKSLPPK